MIVNKKYIVFGIVLFAFLAFSPVFAQSDQPRMPSDDEVNAIAKKMFCPVCENTPLDVCPTQACAEWRELIREKLALGWSEKQITDYFVEQFGDRVMATPPARGLNWLVYLIPPITLLAGAFILFQALRSWRVKNIQPEPIQEAETQVDEYLARIEKELKGR